MGATSLVNVTSRGGAGLSESAPSAADCVMPARDTTRRIEKVQVYVTGKFANQNANLAITQITPEAVTDLRRLGGDV